MAKRGVKRLRHNEKIKNVKMCVYRYTDLTDGIVKYIGIVHKGNLKKRLLQHTLQDDWYLNGVWVVDYFECDTRSEAEAFEAHLIAYYKTGEYYNRAKIKWGINKYLPDTDGWWKRAANPYYADITTVRVARLIKEAIRKGDKGIANHLLDMLEVRYE